MHRFLAGVLAVMLLLTGVITLSVNDAGARNANRLERPRGRDTKDANQQQNDQQHDQSQYDNQNQQGLPPATNGEDFNIGIRKDVIDTGADGQGLKGGAGQANLGGGVNKQGLNGGVGTQNLQGGAGFNGLKMQQAEFENRKPLNANATTFAPLIGGITKVDVERLQQRDVVLIIDRSFSMGKMDCPPASSFGKAFGLPVSRWDWCRDQTRNLAGLTGTYNRGIKLMMFSRGFEAFPDVTMNQVSSLFQRYQPNPETGTDMVDPLRAVLTDYARQKKSGRDPRPLAIAVIFDGLARKGTLPYLQDAIMEAARSTREPNEIQITIFLVGNRGQRVIQPIYEMENSLRSRGRRYNILRVVPFNQVQRVGLAKALADTLKDDN